MYKRQTITDASNPRSAAVPSPLAAQRCATARPAHAIRPASPSPSSTWSWIFNDASTSDTDAASRAPDPMATSADFNPRNAHGPADRRETPLCASTTAEIISPS